VLELVFACRDRQLRRILVDWIVGRSVRESALKRGLARMDVSRLRRKLVELGHTS
jgi:hypothetical protein